jgi:hypothetical protein
MIRFAGYRHSKTDEAEHATSLLLDQVPDKKDLVGDFKISRKCHG